MKFSDFVKTESIRAELAATDKEGVIRELVGCLVESGQLKSCLLYTSPSPRDLSTSRMPSSA